MSENELGIFDPNRKKKKNRKKKREPSDSDVLISDDAPPTDVPPETVIPTDDSNREPTSEFAIDTILSGDACDEGYQDYAYDELLKRVFGIMLERNPDMIAGEKRRIVMKPPQVTRLGTKKSTFSNFFEICKVLHRQPQHLGAFLMAELGTSYCDGNSQLIIRSRYQQKHIERVLRHYIKEYVKCHTCRSPDTLLQKETRLYFLQCETCGSRCSVASIKFGFQAITSKRAAIRAKAT